MLSDLARGCVHGIALLFALPGAGVHSIIVPTFAPVDWWYDATTGALCWDGRTERPALFYVDLDGVHETAVTNDWSNGTGGLFVAPVVAVSRGWTSIPGQDGQTQAQWGETRINPPVPHVRHPQNTQFPQEWYHIFVTKLTPPSDFVIGLQGSDGTHVRPIDGPFWVSEDFGRTFTEFRPGSAPAGPCDEATPAQSAKEEGVQRIKALKVQALARGDSPLVRALDAAEEHLWKSLGYRQPFRPRDVSFDTAVNVSGVRVDHDRVKLTLGPSWGSRLGAYATMRLAWSNGVITVMNLPSKWPDKVAEFRARPWVDAWHQDVHIEAEREDNSSVTVEIQAHQASLGFGVHFDADKVASFSFTYDKLPLWLDSSHLGPKLGHKVFDEEKNAVRKLLCGGDGEGEDDDAGRAAPDIGGFGDNHREHEGRDRGERNLDYGGCGDDDEARDRDGNDEREDGGPPRAGCPADPEMWNASERATIDSECTRIATLLVRADEFIALTAIQDAKGTPIHDPRNAKHIQHEIEKAEGERKNAYVDWQEHDYAGAIRHFGKSWKHAQQAMNQARK